MFKQTDHSQIGSQFVPPQDNNERDTSNRRPNISYAELITMAIESSPDQMLTLKEIYHWISSHYPFFEMKKVGWQNSIRHNLSLNRCFYKVPRQEGSRGKGSYWKINYEFQNVKVNYRTRKYTFVPQQQSIHSLTQILNDNKLLGETIGVNEIPQKSSTIFSGNLRSTEEYTNTYDTNTHGTNTYDNTPNTYCTTYTNTAYSTNYNNTQDDYVDDDSKLDRIFSFK